MNDAALAVVYSHSKVLAVARPEPPHEMAVPGGMVERNETPAGAAVRELYEETGVTATAVRYLGFTRSPSDGRVVHVYLVTSWHGTPYAAEGYRVQWMTWRALRRQARRYGHTLDLIAARLQNTVHA
jgi:ADP-ribose pyrophosphatase YjhB (NUDIX family)